LRSSLKDINQATNRSLEADARDQWRGLLYSAYTVNLTGQRRKLAAMKLPPLLSVMTQLEALYPQANEEEKAQINQIIANTQTTINSYEKFIADLDEILNAQLGSYKNLLKEAVDGNRRLFEAQSEYIRQDNKGDDIYNKYMQQCYLYVVRDYERGLAGKWNEIVLKELY
jgi:hypothetical protein